MTDEDTVATAPRPRSGDGSSLVPSMLVPQDPAAVHDARAFVLDRCREADVEEDVCDTAVLLASEVVTNAILHGRSEARLAVSISPTHLHIEVGDDNSRHPSRVRRDDGALDGRGIAIVDVLATDWGVRDNGVGKLVWFELSRA